MTVEAATITSRSDGSGELMLMKPLLRGWLHLICFFLAVPAGVAVVLLASTPRAQTAALIYAVGLIALFGVSGAYHRGPWSPAWRRRMQRLDHTTIFVMIAGSYTPICLLVLRSWLGAVLLVLVWTGALVGGLLAYLDGTAVRYVKNGLYITLGWFVVFAMPQMAAGLSASQLTLVAVGGALFTVGAIGLATRWPDPFPRVFGYHEVWHTLVVAAVVCHFVALASVIQQPVGA